MIPMQEIEKAYERMLKSDVKYRFVIDMATLKGWTRPAAGPRLHGHVGLYGPADRAESIATIHAALDAGVTLLDTGDFYGMGHNEMLIREALAGSAATSVQISVKFGALRGPGRRLARLRQPSRGGQQFPRLFAAAAGHGLHRHLPPGAARSGRADRGHRRRHRRAGQGRATCGTSACPRSAPSTMRRAAAVHPIADLQIEYSLISRGIEARDPADLPRAGHRHHRLRRAVARADQRPLAQQPRRPASDFRAFSPRFQGDEPRRTIWRWWKSCAPSPAASGASVAQVAIAWVLAQGADIVPLIGARRAGPAGRGAGRAAPSS